MTATTDDLTGTFRLDLKLRGEHPPVRLVIDDGEDGVRVQIVLAEPSHVWAWAKQMGVEPVTGEPSQHGGSTWWYRHTSAQIERDGLNIAVTAVAMSLDLDAVLMTAVEP